MHPLIARRSRSTLRVAAIAAAASLCLANASQAATTRFSGALDDAGNAALVGSDLGAAQFGTDYDVAANLAVYTFVVSIGGQVNFDSSDATLGGLVPYFSLFAGTGSGATFVDSNYYTTGGDFHLVESLAAGTYTLVLGVPQNLSFAENYGAGTLGDGFTGLGDPSALGNAAYEFTATTPVPEPASAWLASLGLAALLAVSRGSPRRSPR